MLPLALKIYQIGDIGFQGLIVGAMQIGIAEIFVDILVGQSSDAMAQLVRQHAIACKELTE